jgi:hypothetical protein
LKGYAAGLQILDSVPLRWVFLQTYEFGAKGCWRV